jgi:glutaconate CoA-transferase subunit B
MEYTIDELMAVTMARLIKDGDVVFHGVASPLPMVASRLAKLTHAPNSVYFAGTGGAMNPTPPFLPTMTQDAVLFEGAEAILTVDYIFNLAARGEMDVMYFSGGQIDKYGNLNNSLIGGIDDIKVKLPGGAGGANLSCEVNKFIIWTTRHRKRVSSSGREIYTLVDKVDFITSTGFYQGGDSREKLGIHGGGPYKVVTELCVFGFDEKSKIMKLETVHPDVTVEDILENTMFTPVVPDEVGVTSHPTEEELEILRNEVDPTGIRKLEFPKDELKRKFEI